MAPGRPGAGEPAGAAGLLSHLMGPDDPLAALNQTYLRLGIHPASHRFLPDVCPPEYLDLLNGIQALSAAAREGRARLVAMMNGPRQEIPRGPLEAIEQQPPG